MTCAMRVAFVIPTQNVLAVLLVMSLTNGSHARGMTSKELQRPKSTYLFPRRLTESSIRTPEMMSDSSSFAKQIPKLPTFVGQLQNSASDTNLRSPIIRILRIPVGDESIRKSSEKRATKKTLPRIFTLQPVDKLDYSKRDAGHMADTYYRERTNTASLHKIKGYSTEPGAPEAILASFERLPLKPDDDDDEEEDGDEPILSEQDRSALRLASEVDSSPTDLDPKRDVNSAPFGSSINADRTPEKSVQQNMTFEFPNQKITPKEHRYSHRYLDNEWRIEDENSSPNVPNLDKFYTNLKRSPEVERRESEGNQGNSDRWTNDLLTNILLGLAGYQRTHVDTSGNLNTESKNTQIPITSLTDTPDIPSRSKTVYLKLIIPMKLRDTKSPSSSTNLINSQRKFQLTPLQLSPPDTLMHVLRKHTAEGNKRSETRIAPRKTSSHVYVDDKYLNIRLFPGSSSPNNFLRARPKGDGKTTEMETLETVEKRRYRSRSWHEQRTPRCNNRHINVKMLLEFFTTGKMCGSNVVRFRYGLGRR